MKIDVLTRRVIGGIRKRIDAKRFSLHVRDIGFGTHTFDFENSKLCGKVPTTLITRGNKLTMTLHADMASQKVNQRFKVTLSKTFDRPFIPRGAIDMVAGQKANENIINTYTVKAKNHTPPRAVARNVFIITIAKYQKSTPKYYF